MRGKPSSFLHFFKLDRITPADAGKTFIAESNSDKAKDHPRGCGENVARLNEVCYNSRITPADAGKTETATTITLNAEDHPRGCGENCGHGDYVK